MVIYLTYLLSFWQKLKKNSIGNNKYPLLNKPAEVRLIQSLSTWVGG